MLIHSSLIFCSSPLWSSSLTAKETQSVSGEPFGVNVFVPSPDSPQLLQAARDHVARLAPMAELAGVMSRLPQILVNVPGVDKARADEDTVLAAAVAEAEAELGDQGRVLLRPSGTEPLVRVMVEAPTAETASGVAERLATVVRERLAL